MAADTTEYICAFSSWPQLQQDMKSISTNKVRSENFNYQLKPQLTQTNILGHLFGKGELHEDLILWDSAKQLQQ